MYPRATVPSFTPLCRARNDIPRTNESEVEFCMIPASRENRMGRFPCAAITASCPPAPHRPNPPPTSPPPQRAYRPHQSPTPPPTPQPPRAKSPSSSILPARCIRWTVSFAGSSRPLTEYHADTALARHNKAGAASVARTRRSVRGSMSACSRAPNVRASPEGRPCLALALLPTRSSTLALRSRVFHLTANWGACILPM